MFFASGPLGRTPLQLSGQGHQAEIEILQRDLIALAEATGRPAVNPGAVTGQLNWQTMLALAAAADHLFKYLQPKDKDEVAHALANPIQSAQAQNLIAQRLVPLSMAIRQAILNETYDKERQGFWNIGPHGHAYGREMHGLGTAWYETKYGMIVLVAGGLLAAYFLYKHLEK
jgi:hypothetical protein